MRFKGFHPNSVIERASTFTAGGTLAPSLPANYVPSTGMEFPIITLNGGSFNGTFAGAGTPSAGTPSAGGSPESGASATRQSASAINGAAGEIKLTLSCAAGKSCQSYRVTGKVTEHLRSGKVTAVSARAGKRAKKKLAKARVVTVASGSGSVDGKTVKTTTVTVTRPKVKRK